MTTYKLWIKVSLDFKLKPILKSQENYKVLEDVMINLFTKVNYPKNINSQAQVSFISMHWKKGIAFLCAVDLDITTDSKKMLKYLRDFNIHPGFIKHFRLVKMV